MKNEMWEQKKEPMVIDKDENANIGENEFREKKTDKLKQKKEPMVRNERNNNKQMYILAKKTTK